MDNPNSVIKISVSIIIILAVLSVGVWIGIAYQSQNTKTVVINSLSSKVVSSIIAYGKVKSISGKNITLNNSGDDLKILIEDSAQIYSFVVKKGNTAPVQQNGSFSDIKVGDNVNVVIKLLPSGAIEGSTVIIPIQNAQ